MFLVFRIDWLAYIYHLLGVCSQGIQGNEMGHPMSFFAYSHFRDYLGSVCLLIFAMNLANPVESIDRLASALRDSPVLESSLEHGKDLTRWVLETLSPEKNMIWKEGWEAMALILAKAHIAKIKDCNVSDLTDVNITTIALAPCQQMDIIAFQNHPTLFQKKSEELKVFHSFIVNELVKKEKSSECRQWLQKIQDDVEDLHLDLTGYKLYDY